MLKAKQMQIMTRITELINTLELYTTAICVARKILRTKQNSKHFPNLKAKCLTILCHVELNVVTKVAQKKCFLPLLEISKNFQAWCTTVVAQKKSLPHT